MKVRHVAAMRHTSAFRLTAGLGAVFVVVLAGVLWLIYTLTVAEFARRIDQTVGNKAHMLAATPPARLPAVMDQAIVDLTSGLEFLALYDANGALVVGDAHLRGPFPLGHVFERRAAAGGAGARVGLAHRQWRAGGRGARHRAHSRPA
jgi:uncharacterized membrane-anchored protein